MTDPEGTASLDGVPAAPPPSGVSANLVNPSSERLVLLLVGSIFVTIMLLFVFVRIYTKIKIVKKSSPDDCMLSSKPFRRVLIATVTCVIAAVRTRQTLFVEEILTPYRLGLWASLSFRYSVRIVLMSCSPHCI